MNDKKAAKLIIKRSKKNPYLYTEAEATYAKMIKRNLKKESESETKWLPYLPVKFKTETFSHQ